MHATAPAPQAVFLCPRGCPLKLLALFQPAPASSQARPVLPPIAAASTRLHGAQHMFLYAAAALLLSALNQGCGMKETV